MTNEEAIKKMQAVKAYMISGNPIWSVTEMSEAFDMAIEALENNDKLAEDLQNCLEMYKKKKAEVEALKQTSWIPCSERLPEENQGVFLTVETVSGHRDVLPSIATYHKGHWWWLDNDKLGNNVIAWMPLPEPFMRG